MADLAKLEEKLETLRDKVHKARDTNKTGISDKLAEEWRAAQAEVAGERQAERGDR